MERDGANERYQAAYDKIDGALALHYSTGDYVSLGMTLQDVATEVLLALRAVIALEALRG